MGEQIDVTESWCSGGGGSAELTGRAVAAADERSLSSWISSLISLNWELKGVMRAEVRVSIVGLRSSTGSSEVDTWWILALEPLAKRESSCGYTLFGPSFSPHPGIG